MSQLKRQSMKRRDVLVGAGITAGAAFSFPKPALSEDLRQLTMVTDWPEGPGLLPSARRLARAIADGTAGRIRIEVFAAGSMVRPLETFDAVQAGVADMYHSFAGYFDRKSPAFHFYSGVPFGFTANELFAWMRFGGGQELWDALTRPVQCQILSLLQHRHADGRLVQPGNHVARWLERPALPNGRPGS